MKRLPAHIWVFLVSYAFFLLNLAENFSSPHDSTTYLNGIIRGEHLANQHHLLYHFAAYAWLNLWQPLFTSVKDYFLVEAFTAMWGSASLAVVFNFYRNRFQLNMASSIAGTAVVAFSYGFWFYSVNIEVYAPPLFFLLLALYILTKPKFTLADAWKVILLHIAAVLFHQVNILFTIVVLYKFWRQRNELGLVKPILRYATAGVLLTGGAYFMVGWFAGGHNSWTEWTKWLLGYTREPGYWHAPSLKALVLAAYGFAHAFIGAHFVFNVAPLRQGLEQALASHSLTDELFIARNISSGAAITLLLLTIVLGLVMLWLLIRFILRFRSVQMRYKGVVAPLLLSFAVYSIFFCFWEPEILEFWIFQSVLWWLILLGTLPVTGLPFGIGKTTAMAVIALQIFLINYFGSMQYLTDKRNDWYYVLAEPMEKNAKENDLILLQEGWILSGFMEYYTPATVRQVSDKDSIQLQTNALIHSSLASGGRIFIYPETFSARFEHNSAYTDSLQSAYPGRVKIFRETNPRILVIQ